MSAFELLVNGERYSGWKSIRLTRGLERAVSDFALAVSERWPLQEQPEPWQIEPGSECKILIDGELVLTGWTDSYTPSFAATSHEIAISGRSKTQDFVDCSITGNGGEFKGLTILEIARILAAPFGIEVVAETPSDVVRDTTLADELIEEAETQCQPSETCFAFVERLARLQELLVTDDFQGRLVLTRAGQQRASDRLVQGENIKSAGARLDNSKRYRDYIVKAQRPGNKNKAKKSAKGKDPWYKGMVGGQIASLTPDEHRADWRNRRLRLMRADARRHVKYAAVGANPGLLRLSEDYDDGWLDAPTESGIGDGDDTETDRGAKVLTEVLGQAHDEGITRYRPKVIIAEQQADDANAAKRADWEMRRRFARAHEATIMVNGWRQQSGVLWAPNMLVECVVPWLTLEREMLISAVDYTYSANEGEICSFTLTLQDAFLPEEFRRAKKKQPRGRKEKAKAVAFWQGMEKGQ